MIQKRGREAEAEAASTTDESFIQNKRSKNGSSSCMPSPPLAAAVAVSPVPEPVQQPATSNGFRINSFNIHRLLITSLMIAAKFTSDLFYSNARYAKVKKKKKKRTLIPFIPTLHPLLSSFIPEHPIWPHRRIMHKHTLPSPSSPQPTKRVNQRALSMHVFFLSPSIDQTHPS
jgi:hypothetical protein